MYNIVNEKRLNDYCEIYGYGDLNFGWIGYY